MWNTVAASSACFCTYVCALSSSQSLPLAVRPILAGGGDGRGGRRAAALLELEEAVVVEGVADVAAAARAGQRGRRCDLGLPPYGLPVAMLALMAFGLVMVVAGAVLLRPLPLRVVTPVLVSLGRLAFPLLLLLLLELRLADDVF